MDDAFLMVDVEKVSAVPRPRNESTAKAGIARGRGYPDHLDRIGTAIGALAGAASIGLAMSATATVTSLAPTRTGAVSCPYLAGDGQRLPAAAAPRDREASQEAGGIMHAGRDT